MTYSLDTPGLLHQLFYLLMISLRVSILNITFPVLFTSSFSNADISYKN